MGKRWAPFLLAAVAAGCAAPGTPPHSPEPLSGTAALGEAAGRNPGTDRQPRLRFKRGAVCLCSTGLSEKDIRRPPGDGDPLPEIRQDVRDHPVDHKKPNDNEEAK